MALRHTYLALLAVVASSLCSAVLTGCTSEAVAARERNDYTTSINRYYEGRPLCLWQNTVKFPLENATPEQARQLGLNALVDSGLLIRRHVHGSNTYELTPEGRSAFSPDVFNHGAGNFCYGRRQVTRLDFARQNSTTTELVEYHYRITQPAAWANEYPIRSAFPQITNELGTDHKAQATLLNTTDGWLVSGTPSIRQPASNMQHTSTLGKAKALLGMKTGQTS